MKVNFIFSLLVFQFLASGLPAARAADPAEVLIGERLFLETRFAQFFAAHAVDVNSPLAQGDPTVESTATTSAPFPGPFAGASINCRSCHLVDEQLLTPGAGMRTYADFARRSPIPAREDGLTVTRRATRRRSSAPRRQAAPRSLCTSTASSAISRTSSRAR